MESQVNDTAMTETSQVEQTTPDRRIHQKRSQKTYEKLVETGFALLQEREFDDISIAELVREAGYSVGAFYARFHSKDEYFNALIAHHLADRAAVRGKLIRTLTPENLLEGLVENLATYFWEHRGFWRAALKRSMRDPEFWTPLRASSGRLATELVQRISSIVGRPLSEHEETNVRFSCQIVLGTINNTIINRPGPIFLGQREFIDHLARAMRLVSNYDELLAGVSR